MAVIVSARLDQRIFRKTLPEFLLLCLFISPWCKQWSPLRCGENSLAVGGAGPGHRAPAIQINRPQCKYLCLEWWVEAWVKSGVMLRAEQRERYLETGVDNNQVHLIKYDTEVHIWSTVLNITVVLALLHLLLLYCTFYFTTFVWQL